MDRLEGWLKQENLKGFLLMISEVVDYRFEDSDWGALQVGLESPSEENDWFDYPLIGRVSLRVEISRFDEEGHIDVKIFLPVGEPCLREQIRAVWMVFNRLDVSPDVELIE
jgi:hypothetical protein